MVVTEAIVNQTPTGLTTSVDLLRPTPEAAATIATAVDYSTAQSFPPEPSAFGLALVAVATLAAIRALGFRLSSAPAKTTRTRTVPAGDARRRAA